MTWELLGKAVAQYGVPAVVGFGLAWTIWSGKLRPNREFDKAEKDAETIRHDYERQLSDLRRDLERQLAEMTTDRNYYRDMTMELIQRYDREVQTSEAAVGTAVRALRRRP